MPTNYDTLTRSGSDKDERDEERGGLSAQALHGTVTHHVPLESIVAPPEYERPAPIVRLPNLEGTLFDRSNLEVEDVSKDKNEEDDDDEDEEDEDRPQRSRQPAPSVAHDIQPAPEQLFVPKLDQEQQPEPDVALQDSGLPPRPLSQEQSHDSVHTGQAEQDEAPNWPEDDQDSAPVTAASAPAHPPRVATASTPPRPETWSGEHTDMPPPPGAPDPGGPPLPPINRPPTSPGGAYPSYNAMPGPAAPAYGNTYERPPAAPYARRHEAQPQYDNNRAVDGFARLMGVGNFIGNRRTRKKLGKQIEQDRRETAANFADIQAQQIRAAEQQRRQAQNLEQLRMNTERAPLPTAPFAAAAREQAPTYASQANPNIPTQRFAEQHRPLPPLPGAEQRPGERRPVPGAAEQLQSQDEVQSVELTPGQHIEHSTWHDIVVDKHGNEVQGARHYGEGFKRSRREIVRDRAGDAAAAGTTALAGIQQQQGYGPIIQYPGTLPSGMTSPALPQGTSRHADPQHQLPAQAKQGSKPGPIFWVMLAVIIAAFFAAAMI